MKKIILFFIVTLVYPVYSFAQIDLSLPVATARGGAVTAVVTDWEAIGINPSNLGWKSNHKFSVSILNVGLSIQSSALDFQTIKNAFTHPNDTFSMVQKQHFAQVLSNPNGLNMYGDVNWLAFSFQVPKVGGFAVNLRDRVTAHLTLSPTASAILFEGLQSAAYQDTNITSQKISHVLDGSNFSYYQYRELNLDWGRKLFQIGGGGGGGQVSAFDTRSSGAIGSSATDTDDFNAFKVYGGIGLKYLWGLANVYANIENATLVGHSSITSSYGINYGDIPNFNPSSVGNLFNNTGHGYAMDLGLSAVYKKWKFGVSATDLGSILWQHNTLVAVDTTMPHLAPGNNGINSWSQIGNFALADNSILSFKPGPDYNLALPAMLRTGASYAIVKRITLSADAVFPLNNVLGNIETPFFALAGQFDLCKGISVCTGFAGSQVYGFEMPLGITLGLKNYIQFYLATSDILTYLIQTKNPNISIAFGLLRFNL